MNVSHFVVDQLADQNLRAFTDRLRRTEDDLSLRMSPPAATNGPTCNRFREARDWSTRGLKYNPMTLDEGDRFFRSHVHLIVEVPPAFLPIQQGCDYSSVPRP